MRNAAINRAPRWEVLQTQWQSTTTFVCGWLSISFTLPLAVTFVCVLSWAGCAWFNLQSRGSSRSVAVALVDDIPLPTADAAAMEAADLVRQGRVFELGNQFFLALDAYLKAEMLAGDDPLIQLHLGEFYRHHHGDWGLAQTCFKKVLDDSTATARQRALALHGIGKMAIWRGEYGAGLAMLEESADLYPTALAYRNLAVFWFSEDAYDLARSYMERAVILDPGDSYNRVFAATFTAFEGRHAEALGVLASVPFDASMNYNFAAVHAELGDFDSALQYLHDHFYDYEYNDRIRAYEMQEARSDYHFRKLLGDPRFEELTSGARTPEGKKGPFWVDESVMPYRASEDSH